MKAPVERDSAFERMFDTRWFVNMSRVAMIVATMVGLPMAGWLMTRLIGKADAISDQVDDTSKRLELLDQTVRFSVESGTREISRLNTTVVDHEARIRAVERDLPRPGAGTTTVIPMAVPSAPARR